MLKRNPARPGPLIGYKPGNSYGGNASLVGQAVNIDSTSYTIVGVLPRDSTIRARRRRSIFRVLRGRMRRRAEADSSALSDG
jgi:hypothetical protein